MLQDGGLPENPYPVPEEAVGTEDQQALSDREVCNTTVLTTWRDEKNRQAEDERRTSKASPRGEADKRLKSKLFLSLGKQGQRYFSQKHQYGKFVEVTFLELWKTLTDTFQNEPNVTNERFVFIGRRQRDNESMEQFFGALVRMNLHNSKRMLSQSWNKRITRNAEFLLSRRLWTKKARKTEKC